MDPWTLDQYNPRLPRRRDADETPQPPCTLSALQNDPKTLELAVESAMYEQSNSNTYKVDIDDLVEAIRLLFSNYTDSMDYDVQEVLLRYLHVKR